MPRGIRYIVLHCTATPQSASIDAIIRYWREKLGWKSPGYHYIIKPSGEIVQLLSLEQVANGVKGFNSVSIHISYIGGVDENNHPIDNRTPGQIASQIQLLKQLKEKYPNARIRGHRDFPDVNKACPSFDVRSWLESVGL